MKNKKQRFVLNLKLKTQPFQEDILNKRFEISRKLYNAVLGEALKRYKEMIKTKKWRKNQNNIFKIYKIEKDDKQRYVLCKPYFQIKNEMLQEFKLNEYSLHNDIKSMQHIFKNNIDSFTAQKIASRVWNSINDNLFGKGEMVHFKGINKSLNSLEGKSNKTGIRYNIKTNMFLWNRLEISTMLNINNNYEISALRNKIRYCRIKRKFVRGKYKYILQLILEGIPPIKVDKNGEIKNDIGYGVIGIDIGTQTIAYVSDYDVKLLELAPRVQNIENEKRKLLRYMDRSKRANNPNNFNENGTIKRGIKLKWNFSNRYIKAKNKLKDLYRKQADIRQLDHNIMINNILKNGNIVKVETMNYKGLQARAKETIVNEKTGKFNKKKRFGKSLANKAPAMFLTMLDNKLKAKDGIYKEINTYKVKASQYNHLTGEYHKKKLSNRWNYFNYRNKTIKVQRDLYSAYLIKNVNDDLKTINDIECIKDFDKFLDLHDKEILRLQGKNNLSSMGI